jgi:hypothetical protein
MSEAFDITQNRNPNAFTDTLEAAKKGDVIVYHRGEFASGIHKTPALRAAGRKAVSLVQRRSGKRSFEYLAQVIRGGN